MSRHLSILTVLALCFSLIGLESGAKAQDLEVSGTCPGDVTFTISGWAPETTVAVLFSTRTGSLRIPTGYYCSGTRLGLSSRHIRILINFYTDETGYGSYAIRLPAGACRGFSQAISLTTCTTSSVEQLP